LTAAHTNKMYYKKMLLDFQRNNAIRWMNAAQAQPQKVKTKRQMKS